MIDFSVLNKEQLDAVMHIDGPCVVIAGAGSGKTRTLTYRIANLIETGIYPEAIVAVTFTNKAAKEMKERVMNLVGEKAFLTNVSTFHSFCARFLRDEITKLGKKFTRRFLIIDEDDSKQIIRDTVKELNIDSNQYNSNRLKEAFSKYKNSKNDMFDSFERRIFDAYQHYLEDNNCLDFDDIILYTIELLKHKHELREYYNKKYTHILVDEFQDTNLVQYELIRLLAGEDKNIFVVGDPDQSIYSFRGANYENQDLFMIEFEPKVVVLNKNYRSKTSILEASNAVIKHNAFRKTEKDLYSDLGEGAPLVYTTRESDRDEAYYVTKMIELLLQSGYEYNDIAVLYRMNAISRVFEESFLRNGLPYVIYGGLSFFQRKEIKDILAYIRVCINEDDNISLKRIINMPRRKLGPTTISKLETYATIHNMSMYKAIDHIDLKGQANTQLKQFKELIKTLKEKINKAKFLEDIVDVVSMGSGYHDMLVSEGNESKDRIENIQELKAVFYQAAIDFGPNHIKTIERLLDELSLYTDLDLDTTNSIKLASVHQVKGLEFEVVFIVALEEGIFPAESAYTLREIEEERRVFYVAMTRAKSKLFLTRSKQRFRYGNLVMLMPSRFIQETGIIEKDPRYVTPFDFLEEQVAEVEDIKLSDKVIHDTFGFGVVVTLDSETMTVAFNMTYGIKSFVVGHPAIKKVKN